MISVRTFLPTLFCIMFVIMPELCAQNPKTDGYKSLWSKSGPPLEYGFKYSGGMGTFSSQHKPLAIYSPEAGKTFFVYSGTTNPDSSHLQIMVSYFDHSTRKVPKPVIVYDKMGVNDPQDNAAISIDGNGYIWIFVSGRARTRPGIIFKSTAPYSIDRFERIMADEIVFPQPWWMNDSCFVLMHTRVTRGRELYSSSSTDGKTWSASSRIAGMGGHHQVTNIYGNKLASAFSYFPEGKLDRRTNIYFIQTTDFGSTWKTIDGKTLATPVTDTRSEALVWDYESEKKLVYLKDLNFDAEGNPVIIALISRDYHPGPSGDPREWMAIHWKDNNWNFTKICESRHNYDMGSLYIERNRWQLIVPTDLGPQTDRTGGEVVVWTSDDDGQTWSKTKTLTSGSRWNNSYVRRPVNAHKDFYAFWTDGNPEQISESRIYFTNRDCNRVWVLPYEMKKDFQRPKRIK